MDPETVQIIDHHRRSGMSFEEIEGALQPILGPRTRDVMREYSQVRDSSGRPRGEVNLGDPADPLNQRE